MQTWKNFKPENLGDWYQYGYECASAGKSLREAHSIFVKCRQTNGNSVRSYTAYRQGYNLRMIEETYKNKNTP